MVSYRALLGILVVPICALAHPFNSADIREVDRGFIQTERSHSAPGPEPVGLVRTSSDDEALDGHSSTRGHGLSDRLLLRRSLSSTSSEGGTEEENSQAEAEMRGILRPLGMHLGDSHAEPIAAWRLSEASLLDGKISDENLKHMLYGKWMTYIRQHPQVSLESEIPGPQATLWKYITTDEGARFGSASNVIDFLLQHEKSFQLSNIEIEYLKALKNRFDATHTLLQPLPSMFRFQMINVPPEQQAKIYHAIYQRNENIRAQERQLVTDSRLLRAFEGEMNWLGGIV